MYAEVLILNPISNHDQILSYAIPAGLRELQAGSLVFVPVRNRTCQGLILEINKKRPLIKNIKNILSSVFAEPVISEQGLELAFWLHDYYVCSLNRAVQLFLPPPVRLIEKKVLTYRAPLELYSLFFGENEERIIKYIQENNGKVRYPLTGKTFAKEEKQAVEYLIDKGYIQVETIFEAAVKGKTQSIIYLKNTELKSADIIKKAPRQAQVLEILAEGPVTLSDIKDKIPNVHSLLKTMSNKGWIEVKKESVRRHPLPGFLKAQRPQEMNIQQKNAIEAISQFIQSSTHKKFLLFGVTGSGKTEVYLNVLELALQQNRQSLYLVPEISLTPQVVSLITKAFGDKVAVLHSAMSPGERFDEWMRIKSSEVMIVVGPRSALFAPFSDLGLIIIDEEHENTYKQSEPDPRYDARIVAEKLSQMYSAVLVLGSATPSLRSYMLSVSDNKGNDYKLLQLPQRVASRPMPEIQIIDMKNDKSNGNNKVLSKKLISALQEVIERDEQAILLINRRGFHTYILCRECGKPLTCPHCAVTLTYHHTSKRLTCHYCNYQRILTDKCPACGSHYLGYLGAGTERAVYELTKVFPGLPVLRMDADTTRKKDSHLNILKQFQDKKAHILIGTQMIAKGLDFPSVTLVGVLNADSLLNMPDYQSSVRTFQLISQVAGRAGRGELPGKVYIQTYQPEHYLFPALIKQDYVEFYEMEMNNRALLEYPPYQRLLRILISGAKEEKVKERVDYLKELLTIEIDKENIKSIVEILGPTPAPITLIKNRFRYHILVKSPKINILQALAVKVRQKFMDSKEDLRIIIDVEPQNLL